MRDSRMQPDGVTVVSENVVGELSSEKRRGRWHCLCRKISFGVEGEEEEATWRVSCSGTEDAPYTAGSTWLEWCAFTGVPEHIVAWRFVFCFAVGGVMPSDFFIRARPERL